MVYEEKILFNKFVGVFRMHYISSRYMKQVEQKVVINGYLHSWIHFISMTLQGSILVQLLFECFLNDLGDGEISKILQVAQLSQRDRDAGWVNYD